MTGQGPGGQARCFVGQQTALEAQLVARWPLRYAKTAAGIRVSFDLQGKVTAIEVHGSMSDAVKSCLRERAVTHFDARKEMTPGMVQCSWAGKYAGGSHVLMTSVQVSQGTE